MPLLKSAAIKNFLTDQTHSDLADLYGFNMECQVNVAQDGGERVDGDFKGKKWLGWTDGTNIWKPFRIPWNAATNPNYTDSYIKFDLQQHAEGIGLTGWDWTHKVSRWVAFDFDAIIGHSEQHKSKMTTLELDQIRQEAEKIEWVTIRKSAGGKGLHLYIFLEPVPTENHNEHAALARAILGNLSALTGFDFRSKVDICGGNMWIWHRRSGKTDGLKLIKKGSILTKDKIPPHWRDHIKVISGQRRKNLPQIIPEIKTGIFEELSGQRPKIKLDETHRKLIEFLTDIKAQWWFNQDHHMLVCHTADLKRAHEELSFCGIFETLATGKEPGTDHNCFAFPLRRGAWGIRRYTPGVQEHESWEQDGAGWTRCYLNQEPDFKTACRSLGGIEDPSGGFVFREAEIAINAAALLGVIFEVANPLRARETKLKQHKDGRLIIEVERKSNDTPSEMQGWLAKGNKPWTKVFNVQLGSPIELEIGNYDDLVRHLITESGEDYGWSLKSDGRWVNEPLHHIKSALGAIGLKHVDITAILGSSVFKPWVLVNQPFQNEYPGDRAWNRNSAQLRFLPAPHSQTLSYPTWTKILNHVGRGLDDAIKQNGWAKANGILSGADYLKCWIASLLQAPLEPLPYLFLYGPESSGKSIFHEALERLITKGYKRADAAITNPSGFNAEIEGALLCIIEEINLSKASAALNRIKDWVTGREILIHRKGETPYHTPNTTHWIQCANDFQYCPVFPGDTRITITYVEYISPLEMVPKRILFPELEKEAPEFVSDLLNLDIPPSTDRLNVPVITTGMKQTLQRLNETALQTFIRDRCCFIPGCKIKYSDLWDRFHEWVDPSEKQHWSKRRMGKELPPEYPKGRNKSDAQWYIGNIWWTDIDPPELPENSHYILGGVDNEFLVFQTNA